jgi:hypothetical protein
VADERAKIPASTGQRLHLAAEIGWTKNRSLWMTYPEGGEAAGMLRLFSRILPCLLPCFLQSVEPLEQICDRKISAPIVAEK